MKGHLKYVASEYVQEADGRGIRPISSVDCEIITQVINILYREGNQQLASILDRWKDVDDNKILNSIISYSENGEEQEMLFDDQDRDGFTQDFISIRDVTIEARDIFSIKCIEGYDEELCGMVYYIVINDVNESLTSIRGASSVNLILKYASSNQRDEEVALLKTKLKNFRNCRFL